MFIFKSIIAIISLVATVSSVSAGPARLTKRDFFCDVKNVHCCEEVLSNKDAGEALGGLLNVPASIIGNVGLGCSPIGLASLGSCAKSTPVCCSQVYQDGLINIGCSPLSAL